VICQPGKPPAVTTPPPGARAGPSLGITFTAQTAGTIAADDSWMQVTAGQRRGDPTQPRGSMPGRGARMRSPAGTVCEHDGLLPVHKRAGIRHYQKVRPAGQRRDRGRVAYPPGTATSDRLYRFRTYRRRCSLWFGRMNWLRQDRGLCPFACST